MKKLIYALNLAVLVVFTLSLVNCSDDPPAKTPPEAGFKVNTQTPLPYELIEFTDMSTNSPDTWYWEFPGGTPSSIWATMLGTKPHILYERYGKYTVKLTSWNKDGSSKKVMVDYITVKYKTGTLTDSRDSKTYKTIQFLTKEWMTQNLDYATPTGSSYYNNDNANAGTYGRLYDWNTATSACPPGWHLPNDGEWTNMIQYVASGDATLGGGMLKEAGTTHWTAPNKGDSLAVEFNAVPGGIKNLDGTYTGLGTEAYYWTSSRTGDISEISSIYRGLTNTSSAIVKNYTSIHSAASVRCIKD